MRKILKSGLKICISLSFITFNVFGAQFAAADTLSGAVQKAIQFDPDLLFAVTHRYTTKEQYMQARADVFPSIDINAGYGAQRNENPTANDISGGTATLPRRETSVMLTQHLFAGFGIRNEINRTKETYRSAAYKISGVANDLALDVTEQYLNVIRQQALVSVANQNIAQHQQIMNMISQRAEAGVDRQADLQQAQGRLALARANMVAQYSFLEDARIKYTKFVGIAPNRLAMPKIPGGEIIPKSVQAAVHIAVMTHPTLKSALADVSAAIAQHQASKSTNYPQLDLILSTNRDRNLNGIKGDNNDQLGMVRLSYNIFRGGKDVAKQRETAYEIQEAEEVKNRTVLEIEQTMRLSWNALVNSQRRLVYLNSHLASSRATLDAYSEQFKAGKRTLFDLLDAQNEYYQSRNQYVSAQYDEIFARFRVLNAMGKLLPYLKIAVPQAAHFERKDDSLESLKEKDVKIIRGEEV